MKHTIKITVILLGMFLLTQLIGIFVVSQYSPVQKQIIDEQGNVINVTSHNLPQFLEPPQEVKPTNALVWIVFAIIFSVFLMFLLMRYKVELILRIWFFVVICLALSITLNSLALNLNYSFLISLAVALPLAFFKVFKRNLIVHNITELLVYPGIAAIFVPILNIWRVVLLLIFISLYDMYAVWHAGFMQKMAKYQIKHVKVFAGFFVPYLGKDQKMEIEKMKKSKSKKDKKIKVNVAILGGGDVVFPIILAGVVLNQLGLIQAILISLGATLALAGLFLLSKKGRFYPAMPFITSGCFIALAIAYLI